MKIEKDVPMPEKRAAHEQSKIYRSKYPFRLMEVGDSFFVDPKGGGDVVGSAAAAWGRRHGVKFNVRKVEGGTRVWRIA